MRTVSLLCDIWTAVLVRRVKEELQKRAPLVLSLHFESTVNEIAADSLLLISE